MDKVKKRKNKPGAGRPPLEFDVEEVRKVCALHPTDEELAAFLKVCVDTITRWKKNPEFRAAYDEGKGTGKLSLRRRQWSAAMNTETTNTGMLIWLGKQYLGQMEDPSLADSDALDAVPSYFASPFEHVSDSFMGFIRDVRSHRYTHYWTKGGRGSTKSSAISLAIVDGLIRNPDTHAVVMREVFATIKDSAYAQIQWAIEELGQTHNFTFKKNPLEITHNPTGQKILFRGLDKPQKLKSIKIPFGYIAWIWYEEASEIRKGMETIRNVNQSLMRGGNKYWAFYSYNPPKSKNNWINVAVDEQMGRDGVMVHASDYRTVPPDWLGPQFILEAEALKEVNPKAYEHEYLGAATGTGGDVFDNVTVERISDETVSALEMSRRGIDFGFKPDPFVFIQTGYNRLYDTLYIYDEIYQAGLHDDEAAAAVLARGITSEIIYADSEDPKGISNLQREGLSGVRGCSKPPKSREHGYRYLQRWQKIVIDPARCPNAMREFVGCEFERDKDGNFLSVIPKKNDHTIDAARYAHEQEIRAIRPASSHTTSSRVYAA